MFMRWLICTFVCSLLALAQLDTAYADADTAFVRPAELEPDIAFWRRVYTEVTTNGGFIHDASNLAVVYEVLQFPADLASRERARRIEDAKQKYVHILERLAQGAENLTAEEQRVKALWPKNTHRSRFAQAAQEVRFQLGQADRFREGLIRSGAWRDYIAATFERMGLPRELAALPHVESSFNPYAYSKVGAAGMWQFMRSTGRRFLRIDGVVDERLDPYRSTEAAARFLEQNYLVLGTWPLALTAYNHGPGGMRRAKEQLGTTDIVKIVRQYKSRTFGFASRNFYVAFLAALEIDRNPEKFFGPLKLDPPDNSRVIKLTSYVPSAAVISALGVERDELRRLNPALLPPVWNGSRYIPRGFELRVPAHIDPVAALAKLEHWGTDAQLADTHHRVRSGETLSTIAARYGVSVRALADLNGLSHPYLIRAGQLLVLPTKAGAVPAAAVARADTQTATRRAAPSTGVVTGAGTYVVRRGDTLSKIAARYGLSEEKLMELNNIRNRHFIYEGQILALADAARAAPPLEAEVTVDNVVAPSPSTPVIAAAEAAEPTTEREAEEIGPSLVPGTLSAASADPNDYSVHEDGTILVQAAETLGHYAEWLGLRASHLRQLNRMSYATPLVIGRPIKLDFSKVPREQFEAKRLEYHRQLQEAFFARYRIKGNEVHVIRRGESVWVLAQQRYNIPIWLLRQYNPDIDLGAVRPGTKLVIPLLEPVVAEPAA